MTRRAFTIGGYRLRATLRHRWTSYVSLALFIAILGGAAMGTVAGARQDRDIVHVTAQPDHDSSQLVGPIQV